MVQKDAAVESCQVVDARVGDTVRPVAFVLAKQGAAPIDETAIICHVGSRLAKYKVPVRVVTVQEFPTTAVANRTKVQKNKLKEVAEGMLGGVLLQEPTGCGDICRTGCGGCPVLLYQLLPSLRVGKNESI